MSYDEYRNLCEVACKKKNIHLQNSSLNDEAEC